MIDVLETLYRRTEPFEAMSGFHVNVTPDEIEARPDLAAWVVRPSSLRHVFAGDDPFDPVLTFALRFGDRAEASAVFPDLIEGPVDPE